MRRSVFVKTFGCQMNSVDSARMISLLSAAEYRRAASLAERGARRRPGSIAYTTRTAVPRSRRRNEAFRTSSN